MLGLCTPVRTEGEDGMLRVQPERNLPACNTRTKAPASGIVECDTMAVENLTAGVSSYSSPETTRKRAQRTASSDGKTRGETQEPVMIMGSACSSTGLAARRGPRALESRCFVWKLG